MSHPLEKGSLVKMLPQCPELLHVMINVHHVIMKNMLFKTICIKHLHKSNLTQFVVMMLNFS